MPKLKGTKPGVHQGAGTKVFIRARIRFPNLPPQRLMRSSDYIVTSRCTPSMIRAREEIRIYLIMIKSPSYATMKLDHIPGSSEWDDAQKALYFRFQDWYRTLYAGKKLPDGRRVISCTMRHCKDESAGQIERSLKMRYGLAKKFIIRGLEQYALISGWTTKVYC